MLKSWSVKITCEHEWHDHIHFDLPAQKARVKGVSETTLTVRRVVDGDDEACDALWAAGQAVNHIRKQYHIHGDQPLHVVAIDIKECE